MSWQAYLTSGRDNNQSRTYTKIDRLSLELPSSAHNLASVCPRNKKFAIEYYTPWTLSDLDNNPLFNDPTMGHFILLANAFTTSVLSKNILLEKFRLPVDDYQLIASVSEQGTAIIVCDGSFDPNDCLGTAAFLMVTNKQDNNTLAGANWSPGTKDNQTAYKSELRGVNCILVVLAILVKHYNIKNE